MKLIFKKNKYLNYAQKVLITPKNIFVITGNRLIALDTDGEYINEVKNLRYVYNGDISADSTTLWLVSNCEYMYSLSLNHFSIKKAKTENARIRFDGKCESSKKHNGLYVSMVDGQNQIVSRFRRYDKNCEYDEIITDKDNIYIMYFEYVESVDKFLIIGLKRYEKENKPILIWYDENNDKKELIETNAFDTDMPLNIEIDDDAKLIYYGVLKEYACDYSGNLVEPSSIKISKKISSLDKNEFENHEEILNLINHSLDQNVYELVTSICVSNDKRYIFVTTNRKLFAIDSQNVQIIDIVKGNFMESDLLYNGNLLTTDGAGFKIYHFE